MIIESKLLAQVIALARYGHFARAAEALHLSQPALSRSIANLEDRLEVRLFDRTRDGVVATEYGRLLIERGQDILNRERELQREVQLMRGLEVGELSVAAGPFPHALSCAKSISRLLSTAPAVQVRVAQFSPFGAVVEVLEGRADLAIADVREWVDDERLILEALPQHRGVWMARAGHPLAGLNGLSIDDVRDFPMVCSVMPAPMATVFGERSGAGRIDEVSGRFLPSVSLDVLSSAAVIAVESDAILLAPPSMARHELEQGKLVILDLHESWQHTSYGFIVKRGRSVSEACRCFMAAMRDVEDKLAEEETELLERYLAH
ncbi:LysR family transcriptional regulator [Chitinibacteraceae bacterium HSL-7]